MTAPLTERGWRPPDTFAMRLKSLRRYLGLTQHEMADRCGLPRISMARWEIGEGPRRMHVVARKVSEATGCDLGWLLYGDTSAPELEERPARARKGGDTPGRLHAGRNNATLTL